MPRVACPAGRKHPNGKAVWHKEKGGTTDDCPICFQGVEPKLAPATEAQPVPKGDVPEKPAAKPASPTPERRPGILRRLGFGDRETSPETPLAPPKNQPPAFFVDAKHTIEFANLIYGGGRWLADTLDKFLMTKEAGLKLFTEAHPELLKLSEFEKEAITLDPQTDMWGRFATGFTRMVGAKTQAQAHSAIDTLSLLGHFGALMGFAASHYIDAYKAGKPYREAKKAAKKAAIEARKRGVRDDRRTEPEPVGEGGTVPQPRPGNPAAAA